MHWPNLDQTAPHDEVKFVIADRADFDYAKRRGPPATLAGPRRGDALLAGVPACSAAELAPVDSRGPVSARLQLQAHKYIWSPETRGRVMPPSAVVLLSGGLDSATAAHCAAATATRCTDSRFATVKCTPAKSTPPPCRRRARIRRTHRSSTSTSPRLAARRPRCAIARCRIPQTAVRNRRFHRPTCRPAIRSLLCSRLGVGGSARRRSRIVIGDQRARLLRLSGLPSRVPRGVRVLGDARDAGRCRRPAASGSGRRSSTLTKAAIIRVGLELGLDYGHDPQLLRPGARTARALRALRQLPASGRGSPRPASSTRCCHASVVRRDVGRSRGPPPPGTVFALGDARPAIPVGDGVMTWSAGITYQTPKSQRLTKEDANRLAERDSPGTSSRWRAAGPTTIASRRTW
jgi:hypothetical protein